MRERTQGNSCNIQDERMAAKSRRYMILGNEKELDMQALQQVGPIKRLSLEEIFGY